MRSGWRRWPRRCPRSRSRRESRRGRSADYAAAVAIWRPLAETGRRRRRSSTSARPIASAAGCRSTWRGADLVRARRRQGPSRRPDDARAAAVPERQPRRRAALAQGRRRARASRARMLVYGTALFNGDGVAAGPGARLCLCQPRRGAGPAPAKDTLASSTRSCRSRSAQEGRWRSRWPRPEETAPAEAAAQAGRQAAAQAGGQASRRPLPAPPKRRPRRQARADRRRDGSTGPGWRIQLGAFSKRSSAEALFGKLSGNGALAGRQAASTSPSARSPGCRSGRSQRGPPRRRPAPR